MISRIIFLAANVERDAVQENNSETQANSLDVIVNHQEGIYQSSL